jgi:hypothetical protein
MGSILLSVEKGVDAVFQASFKIAYTLYKVALTVSGVQSEEYQLAELLIIDVQNPMFQSLIDAVN